MVDIDIFPSRELFHLLAVFGVFLAVVIAFVAIGLHYLGDDQ